MLAFRFQFARNKHRTKHLFLLGLRKRSGIFADLQVYLLDLLLFVIVLLKGKMISVKFYRRSQYSKYMPILELLEWRFLELVNLAADPARSCLGSRLGAFLLRRSDYLWARPVQASARQAYLKPISGIFRDLGQFQDTRVAVLGRLNEPVSFEGFPPSSGPATLSLHLGFAETVDPRLAKEEMHLRISLERKDGKKRELDLPFSFEFDNPNNKTWLWRVGQSWTKFEIPLDGEERAAGVERVIVRVEHSASVPAQAAPSIAVASPFVYSPERKGPRAIFFVVESLTDLGLLEKLYGVPRSDGGLLAALGPEGIYYPRAFSAGDATLTSAGTFMTGLLPSGHQTGSYSFNPWLYNECVPLPKAVPTVAERIRATGAETFMRASMQRFSASYDFYRGFDASYTRQEESVTNELEFLTHLSHRPGYLFTHVNTAHMPLHVDSFGGGADQRITLRGGADEDVHAFVERAERSFLQLLSLIERLKTLGTWDETTLVVTGDHGCNLGPWEKKLDFSLYQMRTQVPLYVKPARGARVSLPDASELVQAHQLAVHAVLSTFGLESEYSIRKSDRLGTYVTTETTHQPRADDYATCLTTEDFRYFYRAKMDWRTRQVRRFESESLYAREPATGLYKETVSVAATNPEVTAHFRQLVERDLEHNLKLSREVAKLSAQL